MTNDAQWVVQKSDTSQVQVFKYDGSSFVLNQTITVNFTISRVRLSDNHLFLYIVENGASFDIYKFGGSSFAYAQSITGLGSGNKEISSTADGSVVIIGNPSTNSAYIYDYNNGTGQYSLATSIADGTNYTPLLCAIRQDKMYVSITTSSQPTLFLNSSYQQIGTVSTPASSTYFSYDGTVWLMADNSNVYVYTEKCPAS